MPEIDGTTTVTAEVPQQTVEVHPADPPLAPRTTEEEDRGTASHRVINLKWESTQQVIAIGVTIAVLVDCTYLLIFGISELQQAAFIFLTNIAFLIIGTYFQRTNHTKSSGGDGRR